MSSASFEIVFGSQVRGDADTYSDRDILIVDNSPDVLRDRCEELTASGWSVATYTFSKFRYMAGSGSLFVQHLKDEGLIWRDYDGHGKSILDTYSPKKDYSCELAENRVIGGVLAGWPAEGVGPLWAADVLYVCIRNYGILKLAQSSVYQFAFNGVLRTLHDHGHLSAEAVSAFEPLRELKATYRTSKGSENVAAAFDMVNRASALLQREYFVGPYPISSKQVLTNARAMGASTPLYARVRNLEKLAVASELFIPSNNVWLSEVRKWVSSPRQYAFAAGTLEDWAIANLGRDASRLWHPLDTLPPPPLPMRT